MTPENFVDRLKDIYGEELDSIILYGSAAGQDFSKKYSHYDLMVILRDISLPSLVKSAKVCQKWMRAGNPAPLFVDQAHLKTSLDIFPIEFYDMKGRHKVLFGKSPFAALEVRPDHLRLQCESELKSKLIALRSELLRVYPHQRRLRELLLVSSSSFFAIFRGVLRLLGEAVPPTKREVLATLQQKTRLDVSVMERLLEIREGGELTKSQVIPLMEEYLTTMERVTSYVDQL